VALQEWDCGFTNDCFYSCRDCVLYVVKMMTRVRGRTLPQPGEGVTGPCYDISLSCCCGGAVGGLYSSFISVGVSQLAASCCNIPVVDESDDRQLVTGRS
jgi:hypothetical protein